MGQLIKEFNQEEFHLDLKRYLNLAKEQTWWKLISGISLFTIFLGVIIGASLFDIFNNPEQKFSPYQLTIYLFIGPLLIAWTFTIWWLRINLQIKKLLKNLHHQDFIYDWSLWNKRKYLNLFSWLAKNNFHFQTVASTLKETNQKFNRYQVHELQKGPQTILSPLQKEFITWMGWEWIFIVFYFLGWIFFSIPMLYLQIKYRCHLYFNFYRVPNNEIVQKNFAKLNQELFDLLTIEPVFSQGTTINPHQK